MIKIENPKICCLDETIEAIGLSYNVKGKPSTAYKLGIKPPCTAHDSYLKGITINFYLTAPHYFIVEMQRYHFIDIVMSESKMHSISVYAKDPQFFYDHLSDKVDSRIKAVLDELIERYREAPTEENFLTLLANIPLDFHLKMYMTTNFLQLKNIYLQRHNHRLPEWREFCKWIKKLPLLEEILNDMEDNNE